MILAILQARTSSKRLPGKVLKQIMGKPMLQLQLERLKLSARINQIIVATSTDASDNKIAELCMKIDISCFRGSLDDVLDRYYKAALQYKARHIVRVTGDCPLIDPGVIDELIAFYFKEHYDYACNTIQPTFPDGLDSWIFTFDALKKAWKNAKLHSEREHVVLYMKNNPQLFKIGSYENKIDLSDLRWTVDEPEDLEFVTLIYDKLYRQESPFTSQDILKLLEEEPLLAKINSEFIRDEGLLHSLNDEKKIK